MSEPGFGGDFKIKEILSVNYALLLRNCFVEDTKIPVMQTVFTKETLKAEHLIRDVPDFPKPGIMFKDITPVLADPDAMREVIDRFIEFARPKLPTAIVGIE